MNKTYDIVFVTHLPAFYKVNLYQALAKKCNIYVIFIGQASQIRAKDFVSTEFGFDHCILDPHAFEKRSRIGNIFRIRKLLKQLDYKCLVVGGWDLPEFWALIFSSPKEKNALALESSVYESPTTGWRGWIKKRFLSRISTVFASGLPHQQLLEALEFKGNTRKTLGVGLFNYSEKAASTEHTFQGRFLTVARLAPEKNLQRLIEAFRDLLQFELIIVGDGPLKEQLQAICTPNVRLIGHVPNHELARLYQQQDVFILPSLREPWGLVVEEALYHGMPVIASQTVGSAPDLISAKNTGMLFDPNSTDSIRQAILKSQLHYNDWRQQALQSDFIARDVVQVQQYLESVS